MADRTMWGVVAAAGTVMSGAGYKVDHVDTGVYTILFDIPFSRMPAVVTTQLFPNTAESKGGDPRDNSIVCYINYDRFRVVTGQDNGDKVNRDFSFVAVGPA